MTMIKYIGWIFDKGKHIKTELVYIGLIIYESDKSIKLKDNKGITATILKDKIIERKDY